MQVRHFSSRKTRASVALGFFSIFEGSMETRYWRKFKSVSHVKEAAGVVDVEFSDASDQFAVCSGARVQIYNKRSNTVSKTITRFKEYVNCASFRRDGQLLVAGDGSGLVQVFDLNSRAILRTFRDHQESVKSTKFLCNNTQLVSTSDDHSVRVWDISQNKCVASFLDDHQDYVRSSAVSRTNPDLVLTGSYDHTVKLFDLRANKAVMSMEHLNDGVATPVESVLLFPGDSVAVSAAGNTIKVWDLLGGGRVLYSASNHQKTITDMCFNSQYTRLLTSSLDHHVKIYDVADYRVTHSVRYPSPLLSIAMSKDETHLVTGMSSGLLTIRERPIEIQQQQSQNVP